MVEKQSSQEPLASPTAARRRLSPTVQLTLLVIPLVLIGIGWTLWQQLQESPDREAGVDIPPYGIITVRMTTDPFPALTTGTVKMMLSLRAPSGQMTMVERVTYTYGPVAGNEVFQGEAQPTGMQSFQGPLRFTSVGNWWVKVRVENRGASSEVKFTIPVEPAM